jgi:hypothetical protein
MYSPTDYRITPEDPAALRTAGPALQSLADRVAAAVFRTDLTRPGFALLDLGTTWTPPGFRALLIALCAALDRSYGRPDRRLTLVSLNRTDQQFSTEAHLDGGPDESILMLGYEPSEVISRILLLDYTRAAADRGLTPQEFLGRFNPMTRGGREVLAPCTTEVEQPPPDHYRVLVVNNSSCPLDRADRGMLGVLHKAVIPVAVPGRPRVINSLMLSPAHPGLSPGAVQAFIGEGTPAAV